LKTEFAPRPDKLNPEFTKAMNKMFKKYRAMSFEEKVRFIKKKKTVMRQWVEPTKRQEGLF
jgi:predicted translin family RNA/ssDNA-binding protein